MDIDKSNKIYLFKLVRRSVHKVNRLNLKRAYKKRWLSRWFKRGLLFIILVHILGILVNYLLFKYEFWDNDPDRGSVSVDFASFGENHKTPHYLDQNWTNRESLWFYKTSQGSNLLPYDFYMSLEQAGNDKPFSDNENLSKYQFLIQKKTHSNPDALPVGFAKDTFKGKEYIGLTCAACHTSQINYTNKDGVIEAIRIDGGSGQSNTEQFMYDLSAALDETLCTDQKSTCDSKKWNRFSEKVLKRNGFKKAFFGGKNYKNESEIRKDLEALSLNIKLYNEANKPDSPYGFSRLDAFGRIYNRVVQHVIDKKTLNKILSEFLEEEQISNIIKNIENTGNDQIHLVDKTLSFLNEVQRDIFQKIIFSKANAPVSYPPLWDIPFHDYLQWNGMAKNAGGGSLGRNIGQVIGVFGTINWKEAKGFSPSDLLIEKKSVLENINFHSSINSRNLLRIETQLEKLTSPQWPEDKFGKIDKEKSKAGKKIYNQYCLACHSNIERDNPQRRITAHLTSLKNIGTDPKMATNSVEKVGYTGILQGSYVNVPVGKILLQEKAPVSLMVTAATENSLKTADYDTDILARWSDWLYDTFIAIVKNPVEETIKKGDYDIDTTKEPFNSLLAYKARPLNGIWATAPYLHNGSVPTLYDLLLPAELRPKKFMVGSRLFNTHDVGFKDRPSQYMTYRNIAFDPEKLDFESDEYPGFIFNTTLEGNSNKGHEYAAGKSAQPSGIKLPPLNEVQRRQLLEYLKSL